jgi:hypothetical protein
MSNVFINYLKTNSKELTHYIMNELKHRIKIEINEFDEGCEFYSKYILDEDIMDIAGWKIKYEVKEKLIYLFYGFFSDNMDDELKIQNVLNGYVRWTPNEVAEKLFTNKTKIIENVIIKEIENEKKPGFINNIIVKDGNLL